MNTRKLIGPSKGAAAALLVGLLSQQAMAAEESVVQVTVVKTEGTKVDTRLFRSDVERYIRDFNEQLRISLDQDLKRELAPSVQLAASVAPTRG